MFILIPLVLILLSAAGIFAIIWRKLPYLRKLSVTDVHSGPGILADFFPELSENINSTRLKHYRMVWFIELEKFLRRLRVLSLKIDRASDSLIIKIRKFTERKHPLVTEPVLEDKKKAIKEEEQRLIIEIAKNPKSPSLYEALGDLYVKMKNFTDAKESYEAAIELDPSKEELKVKHSQVVQKLV